MSLPLTRVEGVPQRNEIVRGMAYYAGTGPFGEQCRNCKWFGYWRKSSVSDKTYRTQACEKFKKMTGKFGPRFDPHTPACKYFEKKG